MIISDLLAHINRYRNKLDAKFVKIINDNHFEHHISNEWRLKDLMAHILWYENEMINLLITRELKGSEYWQLPMRSRNRKITCECYNITNEKLIEDYKNSKIRLINEINKLNDEILTNPIYFKNMPVDWTVLKLLEDNTYNHYRNHIDQLEKNHTF